MLSKPEAPEHLPIVPVIDAIAQAADVDRRPGQAADSHEAEDGLAAAQSARAAAERGEGNAVSWTVDIVLAYLARNSLDSQALPKLIADLHGVLEQISTAERPPETGLRPAVPISASVTPDYIVCLEDGRRFKSMKRYIKAAYNLTPEEYRERWGLPATYPMIAPGYAALCSARAKSQKLGRRPDR